MTHIWHPDHGMVPVNVVTASNAVSDYDADLMLGRNEQADEWQVFIKNGPHDGQPFPVMSLGRELPPYDRIQQLLYTNDVRRHGHKIVEQIQRRVDARKRESDARMHDIAEESAELIEHAMRKGGMLPNDSRIFVPQSAGKE